MRVVKPIEITESNYITSTILEPDTTQGEVEWSANYNGASYDIGQGVNSALASNGSVDYLIDGATFKLTTYLNGISQSEVNLSEPEYFVSDAHYYNGVIYIADLTSIRYFNVSTLAEGTAIVNGGIETGTVFASICSIGTNFYLYDRTHTKVKTYTLSGTVLTYVSEVEVDFGVLYPKLTTADLGGFACFAEGLLSIYSNSFNLVRSESVDTLKPQDINSGGISNNGTEYKIVNANETKIQAYGYDFNYKGLYYPKDRVIKLSTHKLYECAIETTDDPEDGVGNVPKTWVEVSATNKWALLDYKKSTQSKATTTLDVAFKSSEIVTSVSAFDIDNVTSIRVIATSDGSGEIYNTLFDTTGSIELVVLDIPPFNDLTVEVRFAGSDILVGEVVVGNVTTLGTLVAGVISDRIDYSRTAYDEFGELTYVERPIVRYTTYPVVTSKASALAVERYLDSLKGSQAVWVGDMGGGDLITTFGSIERSPMTYNNQSIVEYQIKVRGSI